MRSTDQPLNPSLPLAKDIERWPVDHLIPYARNARTHSETQIAQIAASIREFGFTNPILGIPRMASSRAMVACSRPAN